MSQLHEYRPDRRRASETPWPAARSRRGPRVDSRGLGWLRGRAHRRGLGRDDPACGGCRPLIRSQVRLIVELSQDALPPETTGASTLELHALAAALRSPRRL